MLRLRSARLFSLPPCTAVLCAAVFQCAASGNSFLPVASLGQVNGTSPPRRRGVSVRQACAKRAVAETNRGIGSGQRASRNVPKQRQPWSIEDPTPRTELGGRSRASPCAATEATALCCQPSTKLVQGAGHVTSVRTAI